MTSFILLGGSGYLGRNFIQYGMQQDPAAHFYVISRSGHAPFDSDVITTIKANVDTTDLLPKLPGQDDYIVDFIGAPEKDPEKSYQLNNKPAQVMQQIAEKPVPKQWALLVVF